MNKIRFDNLFEEIKETKGKLDCLISIVEKIENYITENKVEFSLYFLNNRQLEVNSHNPKNLTKIRKMLREIFGEWKDHITYIGSYFEGAIIKYRSKSIDIRDLIVISVVYSKIEDLPKSITKDGQCGFQEETFTIKNFVCKEIKK
jgi:hypothetical protein